MEKGCVYQVAPFNGKLVASINSTVCTVYVLTCGFRIIFRIEHDCHMPCRTVHYLQEVLYKTRTVYMYMDMHTCIWSYSPCITTWVSKIIPRTNLTAFYPLLRWQSITGVRRENWKTNVPSHRPSSPSMSRPRVILSLWVANSAYTPKLCVLTCVFRVINVLMWNALKECVPWA